MRNNDDGIENAVTFVVLASPGTATLGGSLLAGSKRYLSEAHLRDGSVPADYLLPSDAAFGSSSGPIALDIRLEHDTFKTNVPLCHDGVVNATSFKTADLHAEWCWSPDPFPVGVAAPPPPPPGPRCPPTQSTGLLAALADLPCSSLTLLSPTRARLTLPPLPSYDIEAVEAVSVTLLGAALTSGRATLCHPPFAINPTGGKIALSGALFDGASERDVRTGGAKLTVTLEDDAWTPAMDDDGHAAVLAGLSSSQREALGWETVVAKGLDPSALEQLDRSSIQITLPPFESYDLRAAETLRLTIPARALLSGRDVEVEEELPVRAVAGTATLSGFVDYDPRERAVRSGVSSRWIAESNALFSERMQLNITLADDEWVALDDEEVAASLLASLSAAEPAQFQVYGGQQVDSRALGLDAQAQPTGWDDIVRSNLRSSDLFLHSPRTLLVNLPARANFGIRTPEELSIVLPPLSLASNMSLVVPPVAIEATAGLCFASGSLLDHLHEEDLRTQPLTLNLTLVADSWVELLELKYAHLLIAGITSAQSEPHGWNAEYRDTLKPFHVNRLDARTVVVSLPARPSYDIERPETITIAIPPSAVASNRTLRAMPGLRVLPVPGAAVLTSLARSDDEAALTSAEPYRLQLRVINDTFLPAVLAHDTGVGTFSELRHALRTQRSAAQEPFGWASVVQSSLRSTDLALTNGSTAVAVSVRQAADFDIAMPELLSLSVPPSAVASGQRLRAPETVRIDAKPGVARLRGTLLETPSEAAVRSNVPLYVDVLLEGETFVHSVGTDDGATHGIVEGFASAQSEPQGWNVVVQPLLGATSVSLLDDRTVRITVQPSAQYAISAPETLSLTLPKIALTSNLALAAAPSIVLRATPGDATLGGTLATHPQEVYVRDGRRSSGSHLPASLLITLRGGDTWSPAAVRAGSWAGDGDASLGEREVVAAIVDGMLSEQDEPNGWNVRVRPALAQTNMTLLPDKQTMRFELPPIALYSVHAPETVYITLPAVAVSSAEPIRVEPPLVVIAERRRARFGGHLSASPEESTIRSEGTTNLTIVLEDDTWHPTVGQPHLGRDEHNLQLAIVNGLVSSQSEPHGWAFVVGRALLPTDVHRVDDRTLLVDIRQAASYQITAPESIVAVVPAAATLSRVPPRMHAPLVLRPSLGRARLSGSLLLDASESAITSGDELTLAITLIGDSWAPAVGRLGGADDDAVARALLDGIAPAPLLEGGQAPKGWHAVVQPLLTPHHVSRSSAQTVTIRVPQVRAFSIDEPELLHVTVPAAAVLSGRPVVATPPIRLLATNGTVMVRGSLLANPTEKAMQDADVAPTLRLEVLSDKWARGVGVAPTNASANGGDDSSAGTEAGKATEEMSFLQRYADDVASAELLRGFVSAQNEPFGWNAAVQPLLTPRHLSRPDDQTLVLTIPELARLSYQITKPETVQFTAPGTSLLSGRQVKGLPFFVILPTAGFGTLSNSLVSNNSETDVQGGGMQLTVTLTGDSWVPSIGQRGSGLYVFAATSVQELPQAPCSPPLMFPRPSLMLPCFVPSPPFCTQGIIAHKTGPRCVFFGAERRRWLECASAIDQTRSPFCLPATPLLKGMSSCLFCRPWYKARCFTPSFRTWTARPSRSRYRRFRLTIC